jgi:hypothetical protein
LRALLELAGNGGAWRLFIGVLLAIIRPLILVTMRREPCFFMSRLERR